MMCKKQLQEYRKTNEEANLVCHSISTAHGNSLFIDNKIYNNI